MSYVAEEDPVLRGDCASARVSLALSPRAARAPSSRSPAISAVNVSPTTVNRDVWNGLGCEGGGRKGEGRALSFRDSAFNL